MSRLARRPISLPSGVTVQEHAGVVHVRGPKGELTLGVLPHVRLVLHPDGVGVEALGVDSQSRANCGTMWSLVRNALQGVHEGFVKRLEIEGIGFRAALEGRDIVLHLGYAHPVRFSPPEYVTLSVEKNVITVAGINKDTVGRAAAHIRALKPPEPYKGKGIRYAGEVIRIKAGKKAATAAAG
jgi:large subunit ribosomal protein L6